MSKFETNSMDLGYVKPGQELIAYFNLTEHCKITNLYVKCDCIKAKVGENQVKVQYKVTDIPYHLVHNGVHELPQSKAVQVTFEDGKSEEIKINYIIKK